MPLGVRGRVTLNVLNVASTLKRKSTLSKKASTVSKVSTGKIEPLPEDPESAPGQGRDATNHPFVRLGKSVFQAVKSRVTVKPRGSKDVQGRGSQDSAEEDVGGDGQQSMRSSLKMSEGSGDEMWNTGGADAAKRDTHALHEFRADEWEYENPLIPRFEPEPAVEKIDQEYALMELEKLDQTLKLVHPKLQFAQEQTPELEFQATIQSKLPKTLRLNGQLSSVRPMPVYPGDGVSAAVPRLVVVTGHKGIGGNVGLNGIYERHPDNFCSRPVYQKFLEKRRGAVRSASPDASPGSPQSPGSPTSPKGFTVGRAGGISYNQTAEYMKAPKAKSKSVAKVGAAQGVWFLYFMDAQGRWVIGPFVGSQEAYARCPGSGETVPDGLVGWETWDMGLKYWRRQNQMQAVKGGY